jgi:hypothetical protein
MPKSPPSRTEKADWDEALALVLQLIRARARYDAIAGPHYIPTYFAKVERAPPDPKARKAEKG